jgi:Asp23 family, cell envelope-related function
MTVGYGQSIRRVTDAARRNVINRVESLAGLRVTEVNIAVTYVQTLKSGRCWRSRADRRDGPSPGGASLSYSAGCGIGAPRPGLSFCGSPHFSKLSA